LFAAIAVTVRLMKNDGETNRLGEYLQARRALITPEQMKIPSGPNRRVPGLRREEVALLAGISADYYLRLERGRDHNPSAQVLQSLARVLRLDDVEADYLLGLGVTHPHPRPHRRTERVPERLHHLLAALDVPAFVEGRYFDVLASNPLAVAFSPRFAPGNNRLKSLFLDPEEQEFNDDWVRALTDAVAWFRGSVGDNITDPRAVELVGQLSLASSRFGALWARQDVGRLDGGSTTVNHPSVGTLHLNREKLPVGELLLVIYYPDENSDASEKLRLLASFASPQPARSHRSEQRQQAEPTD